MSEFSFDNYLNRRNQNTPINPLDYTDRPRVTPDKFKEIMAASAAKEAALAEMAEIRRQNEANSLAGQWGLDPNSITGKVVDKGP